ncbi:unnamed protein product, partial [Didymodactylos carnosus]
VSEVPKFVIRGNQLTINYVDETDNGKYTCHAYNDYDKRGQKAEYILLLSTNGVHVDTSQFEQNKLIELRFDPLRREHFGSYSCMAKNMVDTTFVIAIAPIYVGPNTQVVSSVSDYRAPVIQWIKMTRSVQQPESRTLASDIDQGVSDISTKQIGPTLWETTLSVKAFN